MGCASDCKLVSCHGQNEDAKFDKHFRVMVRLAVAMLRIVCQVRRAVFPDKHYVCLAVIITGEGRRRMCWNIKLRGGGR